MRKLKTLFIWVGGCLAALVLSLIAIHTYYVLTPASLSDEAKQLLAETAPMAQFTDNGYRLYGLLAPVGLDPVAYGRCSLPIAKKYGEMRWLDMAKSLEFDAERSAVRSRGESEERLRACADGKPLLPALDDPGEADRIRPDFDVLKFAAAASSAPAAVYFDRWDAVLAGGARGNEPDFTLMLMQEYGTPGKLERARFRAFARRWLQAKTAEQRATSFESFELARWCQV